MHWKVGVPTKETEQMDRSLSPSIHKHPVSLLWEDKSKKVNLQRAARDGVPESERICVWTRIVAAAARK